MTARKGRPTVQIILRLHLVLLSERTNEGHHMKTIPAGKNIEGVLGSAQKERIMLTRDGKPSAILIGIESLDDEDLELAQSEDFWRLIEERRRGRSISLSQLKSRLKLDRSA